MNTLMNTSKYTFTSQNPLFIVNKTFVSGAMRPVAYFPVALPRGGSVLSAPIKESIPIYDRDGEIKKVVYKNTSAPCGDPYGSVANGLLEIPCYSVHDPDNEVADQSHNIYEPMNRKGAGSFSSEPISDILEFLSADQNIKSHMMVNGAVLFKCIGSDGSDVVEPIYATNGADDDDGGDDNDTSFARANTTVG